MLRHLHDVKAFHMYKIYWDFHIIKYILENMTEIFMFFYNYETLLIKYTEILFYFLRL